MRARSASVAESSARAVMPTIPWQAAGSMASGSSTTCARSAIPSRFKPASASSEQVKSPAATRPSRVCTLPRMISTRRSGRRCSNCACRRTEAVPTKAPCGKTASGSSAEPSPHPAPRISASRGSSRSSTQASTMPGGNSVSRSLRLCTATSMRPSASASWISLAKSPLPPISARRLSCTLSPDVAMMCSSSAPSSASAGMAARATLAKCRACQSASGEPRVPMRMG